MLWIGIKGNYWFGLRFVFVVGIVLKFLLFLWFGTWRIIYINDRIERKLRQR